MGAWPSRFYLLIVEFCRVNTPEKILDLDATVLLLMPFFLKKLDRPVKSLGGGGAPPLQKVWGEGIFNRPPYPPSPLHASYAYDWRQQQVIVYQTVKKG